MPGLWSWAVSSGKGLRNVGHLSLGGILGNMSLRDPQQRVSWGAAVTEYHLPAGSGPTAELSRPGAWTPNLCLGFLYGAQDSAPGRERWLSVGVGRTGIWPPQEGR